MKWYVIKVVTGKEKKMKDIIEKELKHTNSENIINQLLIPTQKTPQIRKGKKINIDKSFFPGYIFVECESINDVESRLKHVSGVSQILKQPLQQSEIDRILGRENQKTDDIFYIGQKIKITDGPFSSFVGDIKEVDQNKQKTKIGILVFGREVLLDLTFLQIEGV